MYRTGSSMCALHSITKLAKPVLSDSFLYCRFLIVRLFSYIILLLSVIIQINCTQPDPQSSGAQCTLDLSQGFRELSAGREEEICPSVRSCTCV